MTSQTSNSATTHPHLVEKMKDFPLKATLGTRGFSCAVSGFGQVLTSDPREKPLDQSAIPLIAPSQLQTRLYQNIQNLDVLLIGSLVACVAGVLKGWEREL